MRGNSQQIHGTWRISCVAAIPQRALDSKLVLPSRCLQGGRYIQQCHKILSAVIWQLQHRSDTLWTCCWKTCKGCLQTTPHWVPSWSLSFGDRPPYLTRLPLPWGHPDGLIQCSACGFGVIEVKSPFKYRNATWQEAAQDTANGCSIEGDSLRLKRHSPWMYQINRQMMITGASYCDFVLNAQTMMATRISRNEVFISQLWDDLRHFLLGSPFRLWRKWISLNTGLFWYIFAFH